MKFGVGDIIRVIDGIDTGTVAIADTEGFSYTIDWEDGTRGTSSEGIVERHCERVRKYNKWKGRRR